MSLLRISSKHALENQKLGISNQKGLGKPVASDTVIIIFFFSKGARHDIMAFRRDRCRQQRVCNGQRLQVGAR